MKKMLPKIILFVVFIGVFAWICSFTGSITNPAGTLWSLLPPVIAIGLALLTKEAYSSLFIGIVFGGLLAANFNPVTAMDKMTNDGFIGAVAGQAGIFIFLVILGILVALINKAGAASAFGEWASKHVKSKVGAALCTFVLGVLIFIDDYFNCLTVGAVMRPVTDKAKISRAKLAYLIDATAAPVCMIAPISSWAAAVSGYAPEGTSGIKLFCQAIPYNLYSLLTFGFIIAITLMKLDYGPMKKFEKNADNGDLFTTGKADVKKEESTGKGKVIDLILPVIVLIVLCVLALVYVGGFFTADSGNQNKFISAFSDTDATVGLPWGGLVALVLAVIYFLCRRVMSFKEAMECVPQGFIAMVPAILILTMATTLKNMTGLLDSDTFVKTTLASAEALSSFLPAIIFVVACAISFATGTSWGTFGILIPIVLAIFPVGSALGTISMSACLAGSVCGDHCSPISDTTIMSSAGAQCNHIDHVSTQLPYALTVAAVSFIGYIIAGLSENLAVTLIVSFVLMVATLFVIRAITNKEKAVPVAAGPAKPAKRK